MGSNGQSSGRGRSINAAERRALDFYVGPEGYDMNAILRGQEPSESDASIEELNQAIDNLTELIGRNRITQPTTVYRGFSVTESFGISPDELSEIIRTGDASSLVGRTFVNDGFTSTSPDREYVDGYGGRYAGFMELNLPRGAKAINQNAVASGLDGTEITINRGMKYRIKSATVRNNQLEVVAEYLSSK